jgi:hypothetical protein
MVTTYAQSRPSRWRTALSVLLIVLAAPLISLTAVAGRARVTVLDTERSVDTVCELADDHAIQAAVTAKATQIIESRLSRLSARIGFVTPDEQTIANAVSAVVQSDEF